MKRLLMGLMLLVTAGAASAEWTRVSETDGFIRFVDKATIRRNGNFVKMWDMSDFKTVKTIAGLSLLSNKIQQEFDCQEDRGRMLALTWFSGQMGNGNAVYSNSDTQKWEPIRPGSSNETLWKIACGKQ